MKDQAEKLRKLMNAKDNNTTKDIVANKTKVLAITSGKGGVGKSNFAVNLAISIKHLGYKVILMDTDFGLANIEILTGTNMKYTLADSITTDKDLYEVMGDGPEGIKLISGGSGFYEFSVISEKNATELLENIQKLESYTDFIIIDTGAGVSNVVLDFVMASNDVIIITTPDPTSVMDAYTMLKTLTINGYKGTLNIVTNMVKNRMEAYNTYYKLNKASNSFLKHELNFLGYLEKTNIVTKAVKNQIPFILSNPTSTISKKINVMALKFIDNKEDDYNEKPTSFTEKLKNFFLKKGDANENKNDGHL